MKNKKYLDFALLVLLVLLSNNYCFSQKKCTSDFLGNWKIKKWIFINATGDINSIGTTSNMKEYIGQENNKDKYLNKNVKIDSSGIYIPGNSRTISYHFDSCYENFFKQPIKTSIVKIKIQKDNKYTYDSFGHELDNDSTVGKQFIHFLDKDYHEKYLLCINTNCRINGHQIKICFLSKNKIAIYRWIDVIVLERK